MNSTFPQLCLGLLFFSSIYFHISKKNLDVAVVYGLQSLAIVALLLQSAADKHSLSLLFVALLTLVVKVILAPAFFIRLIGRHKLTFTVSSYTNTPVTLIIVALITALANSRLLTPLTTISPKYYAALPVMALASIFISLFVMVNRKGALSQIIGILSLENGIVAFAVLSGLEQAATLQLGILFDIVVWLIIATVFISMVYRHNGSLEVTTMRHLKD